MFFSALVIAIAKGALLGVILSFMMGVTTLSLPPIIMLNKAIKPKLLGIFIAICTVGIIFIVYFFNAIQHLIFNFSRLSLWNYLIWQRKKKNKRKYLLALVVAYVQQGMRKNYKGLLI